MFVTAPSFPFPFNSNESNSSGEFEPMRNPKPEEFYNSEAKKLSTANCFQGEESEFREYTSDIMISKKNLRFVSTDFPKDIKKDRKRWTFIEQDAFDIRLTQN